MPDTSAHRKACETLLRYMEELRAGLDLDPKLFWRQVRKDTRVDPNTLAGLRNRSVLIKTHTLDTLARYVTAKLRELHARKKAAAQTPPAATTPPVPGASSSDATP